MGIGSLAGYMSEDWFFRCKFQYLRYLYVCFIPFEYQEAPMLQYAKTL